MSVDFEASCELAWRRFRERLADRLAELDEDEFVVVGMRTELDDDDRDGAAPYLQFLNCGEEQLRAEAVSNTYLDSRFALEPDDEAALVEIGWTPAQVDEDGGPVAGFENAHVFATLRDADRIAAIAVDTLRRVFRCAHPLFLHADGLEEDEGWVEPGPPTEEPVVEQVAAHVFDRDHLQRLVDAALEVMFESPAEHDGDGDIPITCGLSRAFVRVLEDRPAVEIYAYAVVGVRDSEVALIEVDELNETFPDVQWYVEDDDRIVARSVLLAQPFVAGHLREAVTRFCEELDDTAQSLAGAARGARFLQRRLPPRPGDDGAADQLVPEADVDDAHPAMVALLEMLHEDDVHLATVASVFEGDRHELVHQIVRVRTGVQYLDGLDEERVLRHLRRALRLVADRQARAERAGLRSERPSTRQLSLLPEEDLGQGTLDAGWGA